MPRLSIAAVTFGILLFDTRDRRVIDIFPEPAGALSGPVGDPRDRRGGLELRAAPEQRPESRSSYRIEEK